tara:strand:- start:389 stop:793 length:405 start_codon:yes stop_codon:yes gene_type:complete
MGQNSQGVAYNFGQLGSGHLKTRATDLVPPHGRVIVAITMLEAVKFDQLVGATDGSSTLVDAADSLGDGVAFIGTQTQTRANGLDQADSTAESETIANTVEFPAGMTIYGRWNRVSLHDGSSDYNDGIIVYYGI